MEVNIFFWETERMDSFWETTRMASLKGSPLTPADYVKSCP